MTSLAAVLLDVQRARVADLTNALDALARAVDADPGSAAPVNALRHANDALAEVTNLVEGLAHGAREPDAADASHDARLARFWRAFLPAITAWWVADGAGPGQGPGT